MKKILFFISIITFQISYAQGPLVRKWDRGYGGDLVDDGMIIQQTSDNGFILGGTSFSNISGDKSQPCWDSIGQTDDCWIIKIDSLGNKQWDKTFGGDNTDNLWSIIETRDGGYLLGCESASGISGDKTQPLWGFFDNWIVKIDSAGNKQWDKSFGGEDQDVRTKVLQTSDGGYIILSTSASDSSGNKSESTKGNFDYWIIKIDSVGIKEWDHDYGGYSWDYPEDIFITSDGGYIICGASNSGIGGDKTDSTWGGINDADYWILRLDSAGNKLWDRDFGGDFWDWGLSIYQNSYGGFLIGGYSSSNPSPTKTQPCHGGKDYWIIGTDSLGNPITDKVFGAIGDESFRNLIPTKDSGYILGGCSETMFSNQDKSENNTSSLQTWLVKIDSTLTKEWDKTFHTLANESCKKIIQSKDGCYEIISEIGWPMDTGGDYTHTLWGMSDFWMIKFCDSSFTSPVASFTSAQELCAGSCINFTNLSSEASSYQWLFPGSAQLTSTLSDPTGICYSTPGIYDVQLIAGNSYGLDTLLMQNYITVYPAPTPQYIVQSGDTLSAIQGTMSYQWFYNNNVIPGATDYFWVAQASGNYSVVTTDSNGCEVEATIIDIIANLQYTIDSRQLSIFPNPATETLTVKSSTLFSGADLEISIFNMLGEKIISNSVSLNLTSEIDVHELSSGLYIIEINSGNKSYRTKFMKSTYR